MQNYVKKIQTLAQPKNKKGEWVDVRMWAEIQQLACMFTNIFFGRKKRREQKCTKHSKK